jgi:ParB-like chromosome segregation protein Spo0J
MPKSPQKNISAHSVTTTKSEVTGVPISTELAQEDIHINEEYQALIPPLSREEYKALKHSIATEGQRIKIIVNESGEVLDGHTRFKILKELDREIRFEVLKFPNIETERDFVIQSAILRRNLNAFQKIELAQRALEEERKTAEYRQKQGRRTDTFLPIVGTFQ